MSKEMIELVTAALNGCDLPYLGKGWVSKKRLRRVEFQNGHLTLSIQLGFPIALIADRLKAAMTLAVSGLSGVQTVHIALSSQIEPHGASIKRSSIPGVKNIIAIGSGKGGVGKSTTSVNIACALHQLGARVGLLDADIYGPNQPHMLGVSQEPELINEQLMRPVMRYGLQTISVGYLVDPATPMVWRGPMIVKMLQQLLYQTAWDDLDYLIVDLPPGTGDVQLTMAQKVPVSGAVIVTTPQDVALLDVRKGIEMFRKVDVPILGVVENMSVYRCPHCGEDSHPFGAMGGEGVASDYSVPLLGQLPLSLAVREQADAGEPIVLVDGHTQIREQYQNIALQIAARLSLQATNLAAQINVAVEGEK